MRFTIDSSINRLFFSAIMLLAVSFVPATAQDALGKFTLAKAVHWGRAVLPAGEYNYSLEHQAGQLLFVRSTNNQTSAIVLVNSASFVKDQGHDRITLQRQGDDWFVTSMVIASLGQELSFGSPTGRVEAAKNSATPAKVASLSTP